MDSSKRGKAELHYFSSRLKLKLDRLRQVPAAVVEAPAGYGKTTAIRDFVKNNIPEGTPVYWFTATEETPHAGYNRLCREIEKIDQLTGEHLQRIQLPNTITVGESAEILRSIRCANETYLIIDNFQIMSSSLMPSFVDALLEHGGEGLRVIILTQMLGREARAFVTGRGCMQINMADLKLNAEDVKSYYRLEGVNITEMEAMDIERCTEGWVIAVYLQLCSLKETGRFSDTVSILVLLERLVWDSMTPAQQEFLLQISPFSTVTLRQACAIAGLSELPEYARGALNCPFIHYASAEGRYELHSILTDLLVHKRIEHGTEFERKCLIDAGDFCRAEGKIALALGHYAEVKDYDRMLSLDLSHMTLETIGTRTFAQLASDIVESCPAAVKRVHLLSMLQISWALLVSGMKGKFSALLDELLQMPELSENAELHGEWLLLASYREFPDIAKMTELIKEAAIKFGGRFSRVILPEIPWCFGNYSPFTELHTRPGQADHEADMLEQYINIYSSITNGHGCGGDALFRSELAYHRGDLQNAEIYAYKAAFLAEGNRQSIVSMGASLQLAEVALHKGDTAGWQHAISSMERAVLAAPRNNTAIKSILDMMRGVLLAELNVCSDIADWLKERSFSDHGLSYCTTYNALFVHFMYLLQNGEFARMLGTAAAIDMEYVNARPFSEHLLHITSAVCNYALGNKEKAAELVLKAVEKAVPDRLIFTLASFSKIVGNLTEEIVEQYYPQYLDELERVKERFFSGWETVHNAISPDDIIADLTHREYEVAKLAAAGMSNSEIAEVLVITENTVRTHLRTVFQKLDINRRAKLAHKLK
ncbi:MAG TPA: LuxR C-terminal-related transcriptional regulator [Negativicutes bacterium]|nr:LuxR C-terminal-related transcriptional regulator [Negativicutes bacterium]